MVKQPEPLNQFENSKLHQNVIIVQQTLAHTLSHEFKNFGVKWKFMKKIRTFFVNSCSWSHCLYQAIKNWCYCRIDVQYESYNSMSLLDNQDCVELVETLCGTFEIFEANHIYQQI